MSVTRVALVDDHPVLVAGMVAIFGGLPDFEVVATGGSTDEALQIVAQYRPDVLFMDLSMPGSVFSAITSISQNYAETKIVVFTAFSSVDSALRALSAGAKGFVLKGSTFQELIEAVEFVRRDEMYITKQYASQVMTGLLNRERALGQKETIKLSIREKQIVDNLMHARTNREIAANLDISEKTVKHYMTGLMAKLSVRNRLEVVIEAQRKGGFN